MPNGEKQRLLRKNTDVDIKYVIDNPDNRKVHRISSVILPDSGERVHRSLSFSNSNFESFENAIMDRDEAIDDSIDESFDFPSLIQLDISIRDRIRLFMYYLMNRFNEMYNDEKFKNVLKCSFAYLIASLGIFWSPFNSFLGKSDMKHVISTVVVYFHPSRSKGSMHITLIYVTISLSYSFIISFLCRFLSSYFYKNGSEEISYSIDLLIASTSLGVIAYMKQKINKETFNTACSLASISIVACIIKEGSLNGADIPIERLNSTLKIVVAGCIISVAICYTIYPQNALQNLKNDLNECYKIMSSLLSLVTKRFLTGEKLSNQDNEIFNKLKSRIRTLDKNLEESKYELYVVGKESEWVKLEQLVNITKSLANHLFALRSSSEMQWQLLHEVDQNSSSSVASSLKSYHSSLMVSQSVENLVSIGNEANISNVSGGDLDYTAINSAQIFDLFVYYLAPSMKAFIFTLKNILNDVPFDSRNIQGSYNKTQKFKKSLRIALNLFDEKQLKSFDKLYNQEIFKSKNDLLFRSDLEEVTACCGNFSSLLQLFGKELSSFLNLLHDYNDGMNEELDYRTWEWLKIWKTRDVKPKKINKNNINDALLFIQNQYSLNPVDSSDYYFYRLWKYLKVLRRTDVQFGIRVGLGAFVLSLFAFYPRTKLFFNNWRGEWSLTIYCIMMNKSLGGTQMTVKWRILGTFLGSLSAYLVWIMFDGHPVALDLVGVLISIPCFYIIIYWKKNNPFGRFILLTYNLTALYSYTIEQHDLEDDGEGGDNPIIGEIAFHRFVSVSIGIIWAITMASIFIPNSARSRLKNGLTILWLRLGIVWNSDPLDYSYDSKMGKNKLISLKGEMGLNGFLDELELLLKQAPLEFRLKGRFPSNLYEKLIHHTSNIIDAYHNMILMIEVDPILSDNEEYVIRYIEQERHELEHRIFLVFYMIASSIKLQFPLPNKPASTEHAKDRLLYKLNEIRSTTLVNSDDESNNKSEVLLANEDYVLLYSYILVTSTITEELDKIIAVIKQLMGNISEEMFHLV